MAAQSDITPLCQPRRPRRRRRRRRRPRRRPRGRVRERALQPGFPHVFVDPAKLTTILRGSTVVSASFQGRRRRRSHPGPRRRPRGRP